MTLFRVWTDEKGNPSSARCLLWLVVLYLFRVIEVHLTGVPVDSAVWAILTTTIMLFTAWAAGPRLAEYILPQLTGAVSAVGQALRRKENRPFGVSTEPFDKDT
jgi:hypothetical protein